MTVDTTLDRLSLILDFSRVSNNRVPTLDDVIDILGYFFLEIPNEGFVVVPDRHFDSVEFVKKSMGADETNFFWHRSTPVMNVSSVKGQPTYIRLDFNPKRFREDNQLFDALMDALSDLNQEWPFTMHVSQADFAFSITNETGAENMWLWRLGATTSKIMYSRSSAVATRYSGKRSSDIYAKYYDKHQEQVDTIVNRYRAEKIRLKTLKNDGLIDDEELNQLILPALDEMKKNEIDDIPENYWRFEVTVRTPLFLNDREFNKDVVVDRFLDKLSIRNIESINNPVIRAVAIAIESDKVKRNELPPSVKKKYSGVMQWGDVSGYYDDDRHYHLVKTDNVPEGVRISHRITMELDDKISSKVVQSWLDNSSGIQDEINSYFNLRS